MTPPCIQYQILARDGHWQAFPGVQTSIKRLNRYARNIGTVIGNLHSLEIALRSYLSKRPGARPLGVLEHSDMYSFPVTSVLPLNDLTSYAPLGELIDVFNQDMRSKGFKEIQKSVVDLRDALAHGRATTDVNEGPMRVIKFNRPAKDSQTVTVSFNETLTEGWFQQQREFVIEALNTVLEHLIPNTGKKHPVADSVYIPL